MDDLDTNYDTDTDTDDEKLLSEIRDKFKKAQEVESDNRRDAESDIEFARLSKQWPEAIRSERESEGRPCLTINRLPAYIRQVVNDARQNKPAIMISPVDDNADIETAEVLKGLVRNIEYSSCADTAYDTAIESAVTCGFGYIRIDVDYAHDDTFDLDIKIERVSNPFAIYGDPDSDSVDSSDWNCAFVVSSMDKKAFEKKYKKDAAVDWDSYLDMDKDDIWVKDEEVVVTEYWRREEKDRVIYRMSDGSVVAEDVYEANAPAYEAQQITPVEERITKTHKVTQYVVTGSEVLEKHDWPGRYIPIVPVYGDEVNFKGKRFFRSLVRDAKDAQRQFNYWRTASTELVALAPKAPFIGPKGAFSADPGKWASANVRSHAFIEYAGEIPPQRQPFAGVPAGALQEAVNSSNDMKDVMGLHDASMGAPSNETSGKAILARQREGDTSTFHFMDNLNRAIEHVGRIVIDLIPHIFTGDRVVRILGENNKDPQNVQLGEQAQPGDEEQGIAAVYNLGVGKYDVAVDTGPSYNTRREEAATQMLELVRVYPQAAPIIADLLATNMDWPGADDIAERFRAMLPPQLQGQNPQVEQLQQVIQQGQQVLQEQQGRIQELETDKSIDGEKLRIDAYKAESDRLKAMQGAMTPEQVQQLVVQTVQQLMNGRDIYQ